MWCDRRNTFPLDYLQLYLSRDWVVCVVINFLYCSCYFNKFFIVLQFLHMEMRHY